MEKARAHALWSGRAARKQAFDAGHPGKYYGVGFGCIQWRFGNGAEGSLAKVELAPDGRITVSHSGTEIGTGMSSGQAVACVRWLGRPADALELAVTDWADLPVETSGDPRTMSQADQDRLAENPRWSSCLRVGVQCQQFVLLLHPYDARSGAHRFCPRAVAGRLGDLDARGDGGIART